MNLQDTLFVIENFLGIETDSLLPFAEADSIGGYHPDPTQRQWGAGAIWDVEGRAIHALIRSLKPVNVVEIGSGTGCSTNHIASALKANGDGHVVTLDRGNTPRINDEHSEYVTVLPGDAFEYLELLPDNSIDFILEDADHSEEMCYRVGELAKRKLVPGGVLVAHDAAHPTVGADVRAGFERAGLKGRVYLTEPSDCGFLFWRKIAQSKGAVLQPDGSVVREYNASEQDLIALKNKHWDEPVLQAQEKQSQSKRKPARKAVK